WGGLGEWSIMWTEYYGPPITRCTDLLYSSVVFSTPAADHGVPPVRWNDHLGDGTCENSRITRVNGGVRHEVGRPADRPPSGPGDGPE
ncbi:MAG: hypothetical protein LC733_05125, partial [Actinobacteria bacterium]|nr:hypothetical protein [Actinomycetota bacterium]